MCSLSVEGLTERVLPVLAPDLRMSCILRVDANIDTYELTVFCIFPGDLAGAQRKHNKEGISATLAIIIYTVC